MHATLLGTGGPRPDPDRAGPATLIDAAGRLLLADAGRGVCLRLAQAGISLDELDAVLITPDREFLTESILGGVDQAVEVANDAGAKRLVLTHLREKPEAALIEMQSYAETRFAGEIIVGRDLMTIEA